MYLAVIVQNNGAPCNGAIIGDSWILTTANCAENSKNVIIGASNSIQTKQNFAISNRKKHSKYDSKNHTNDVGMVKITGKFEFGTNLKSIKYNTQNLGDFLDQGKVFVIDRTFNQETAPTSDTINHHKVPYTLGNLHFCADDVGGYQKDVNFCLHVLNRYDVKGHPGSPIVQQKTETDDGLLIGIYGYDLEAKSSPTYKHYVLSVQTAGVKPFIEQTIKS